MVSTKTLGWEFEGGLLVRRPCALIKVSRMNCVEDYSVDSLRLCSRMFGSVSFLCVCVCDGMR